MATNPLHLGGVPEWTFGDRLRKARDVASVSVDDMAEILEVTGRTIRNYERMATPMKRRDVREWAMRCGVPVDWLLTGAVPPDTSPDQGSRASMWIPGTVHELHPRSTQTELPWAS